MYRYDAVDRLIVEERVAQFREQVARYLAGTLDEDSFRPLRLHNGIYIQRYAPMMRIAIPYGVLSTEQLRMLSSLAQRFDRSYLHFTTRQNVQFNWLKVEDAPDMLADLATVGMHAIQTSGSCIRNITTDAYAGVATDEIVDPRPYAELMRQWSTLHPEFTYLPRKFKVAFNGAKEDRAATALHDLAFDLYKDDAGEVRVIVKVGGGQGRTPRIASVIKDDLHWTELLNYSEAVLRAYNRLGRRDHIFKSRIKILVEALGAEGFAKEVNEDWESFTKGGANTLTNKELDYVRGFFIEPKLDAPKAQGKLPVDPHFRAWRERNVVEHQNPDYVAVTVSLKRERIAPGDMTTDEMNAMADLADKYSHSELRVTHRQNLVLPYVAKSQLFEVWEALKALDFARANIAMASDIITCPGGDFCSLANAKSIPLSAAIAEKLKPIEDELGPIHINVSGCINACAHHHVGHIGVLGVEKNNEEWYQILLGGRSDNQSKLGIITGRAVRGDDVPGVVEKLAKFGLASRQGQETFIQTVERLGIDPFKHALEEPVAA